MFLVRRANFINGMGSLGAAGGAILEGAMVPVAEASKVSGSPVSISSALNLLDVAKVADPSAAASAASSGGGLLSLGSGFDLIGSLTNSLPQALSAGMNLFSTVQSGKAAQGDVKAQLRSLISGNHEQQVKQMKDVIAQQAVLNAKQEKSFGEIGNAIIAITAVSVVGIALVSFMKG